MKLLLFEVVSSLWCFWGPHGVYRLDCFDAVSVFPAPNRVLEEHTEVRVEENLDSVGVFGVVDA